MKNIVNKKFVVSTVSLAVLLLVISATLNVNGIDSASAASDVQFTLKNTYDVGTPGAKDSVSADFNNDGNMDFAVTSYIADHVTDAGQIDVFMGAGNGNFTKKNSITGMYRPSGITSADFNEDGKKDIAITESSGKASIYIGNGDGIFTLNTTLQAGGLPIKIINADLNNDGHADLAVSNNTSNFLSIFTGNGDGTFNTLPNANVGYSSLKSLGAADFNNDGNQDLYIGHFDNTISVLKGNGQGGFTSSQPWVGFMTDAAVAADINNDGNVDLIATELYGNEMAILTGKGDGTFNAAKYTTTSGKANDLKAADLNNDAIVDLASVNYDSSNFSVFLGDNTGTFAQHLETVTGVKPVSLEVRDFNNDGNLDVASVNFNNGQNGTVNIFLQNSNIVPTPTPTPTVTPTPTPSVTPTPTPTATPTPTVTPTPTPTVTPTPVPTVTETLSSKSASYSKRNKVLTVSAKDSLNSSVTLTAKSLDQSVTYGIMKYSSKSKTFTYSGVTQTPNAKILIVSSTGNTFEVSVSFVR